MNTKKLWIACSLLVITDSIGAGVELGRPDRRGHHALAYTASSPARKFGKLEVAFHYLHSGNVIGNDYQLSVTDGVARHFEFGYTAALSSSGSSSSSYLFANGFNQFHGKVTIVNENAYKTKWFPAIAVGAIGRTGVQRVGQVIQYWTGDISDSKSSTNGDFYVVSTKTVTQVKGFPFVLSLGDKVTNASVFGVAGNAPHWQGRLFGAAALVVKGPSKSALIFGSEVAQQPHRIAGLPVASIPTSLDYFLRVVPHLEGSPLQVDFALTQLAGKIAPGVDLNARARFAMGASYHF